MALTEEFKNKLKKVLTERNLTDTEVREYIRETLHLSRSQGNKIFNKLLSEFEKESAGQKPTEVSQFWKFRTIPIKPPKPAAAFKANGNSATAEVKGIDSIRTLEDLVAYCNIDLKIWEPKSFISNIWDEKLQVKAEFKRRADQTNIQDLIKFFAKESANFSPTNFSFNKTVKKGKTIILNLQDLHLGKLSTNKETGHGNYDLSIAKSYFINAVASIMEKAPLNEIEKVVVISGSDLIHFDTEETTTTKGTRLDGDSRWSKVFNEACSLMSKVVEDLATLFKVEVIGVYGNHARLSEYALGAYLKAFFRNHPNVTVNNDPLDRKYVGFGKTLVGFAHGDETKLTDLPLIMMRENQSTISQYEHMIFLTGHIHQDKVIEVKGIKVMVAPALCPPDKYHSAHGYVGNVQTSQGIVLGEDGLEAIFYSKPPAKMV